MLPVCLSQSLSTGENLNQNSTSDALHGKGLSRHHAHKHARKEFERNLDDVLVFELAQYLDLPDCGDWETLLLILKTDLHKKSYE